ncbi:MAG: bis(5'-nucleosyl)-tetraphosphatase (symmetrical) YqeK [Coriobacteriales bacterium]|jgi:predicted HD superfamily hydrolase involved in NAD metabolism|nr:bis(5'-nucleosyl)-tetraphosphatase (symmetrical) YqeK [Coriobacteriales bacterium]
MRADADIRYQQARELLAQRLSGFRLEHSYAVADTAATLAEVYGVDQDAARLAGLLHDWDKGLSADELLARAASFGIELVGGNETFISLLHAQTAAMALGDVFENLEPEITQAISRHTAAAVDMSDLDMIIYIADAIEPLRTESDACNLRNLRDLVGTVTLEELFVRTLEKTLVDLLRRHEPLHPSALEVWNSSVIR